MQRLTPVSRTKSILLISLALTVGLSSCVTSYKRQTKDQSQSAKSQKTQVAAPQEKPGSKSQGASQGGSQDAALSNDAGTASAGGENRVSLTSLLRFLTFHSRSNSEFGQAEQDFVGTLPTSPKRGTMTEAAIVVGLFHKALGPQQQRGFQEEDLSGGPQTGGVGESLEQLVQPYGIDLVDALKVNRWLQHYGVARLAFAALEKSNDTESFKGDVRAEINRQAGLWAALSGGGSPGAAPAGDEPVAAVEEAAPEMLSPADLRGGDALLTEAQTLAGRGKYKEAITLASKISSSDPMYSSAQDRIKSFSDQAVQSLRQRASDAYKRAMPVNDADARSAYLKEAKQLLEEAINNYPSAALIQTVRNNLEVISRELDKLAAETANNKPG